MHQIIIKFDKGYPTSDDRGQTFEVAAKVISATADSIKRILAKEKHNINGWLLYGKVNLTVSFKETGEVIATGWYEYNAFAGRGEYQFQMER